MRRNSGQTSHQSIFPNPFCLRRSSVLGLLGEQKAVALLEGNTVARVLVIGGETSRVTIMEDAGKRLLTE